MKGYFVYNNLKYTVTKRKIRGESDIDLAIYNLETDDKAIVEVKGWHSEIFSLSYFLTTDIQNYSDNRIFNFLRPEAIETATNFFKTDNFRKILVVSKLAPTQKEECKKRLKEIKIDVQRIPRRRGAGQPELFLRGGVAKPPIRSNPYLLPGTRKVFMDSRL
jgi:hypothetical protein